jgi:hypothetical protein
VPEGAAQERVDMIDKATAGLESAPRMQGAGVRFYTVDIA